MNVNKIAPQKNKAQAMVEFALVLPLLLLLLYGILEAGRLLFIYSSVVTASRQAVRYGSATGEGSGGVPRYQDCDGIRLAAQRVDYLNAFADDDIVIEYDSGPNTPISDTCDGAVDPSVSPSTGNNSRLRVTIDGDYLPIVPKIVGFLERSDSKSNPIKAQSARTILVSVSIQVTAPPPAYTPSTSTATNTPPYTPTKTATNTPTNTATLTPIYSFTPSFTPTITLSPTITLTPTITTSPTISPTPSRTPTSVPICNNLVPGNIAFSGSTMTLTIMNPNVYSVRVKDVFVVWDHDKGHSEGNNKELHLIGASLGGQFWTGESLGPSETLAPSPATAVVIPGGNAISTIIFTFHQSYDHSDASEEILINLSTPGCELYPIHVKSSNK